MKNVFELNPAIHKMNVIELNPKLEIGTGDVELFLEVKDGDKVLLNKKADSLVANFLRHIYSFMSSEVLPSGMRYLKQDAAGVMDNTGSSSSFLGAITNVTVGASTVITHPNTGFTSAVGESVSISGVSGITPDINGVHTITARTSTTITIAVATTGSFVDQGARVRVLKNIENSALRSSTETFAGFFMRIGRSATANITDQQWLINEWDESEGSVGETNELEYGPVIQSTPAFNYTARSSEVTFSTVVTNNSGASVDFNEVGLFNYFYNGAFDDRIALMARDILPSPLTITNGSSVSVSYKIVVSALSTGGFTDYFLNILALFFDTTTNRTFTDILGTTSSYGESNGALLLNAPPGDSFANTSLSGVRGQYVGLQVGTGTTAFAFNDRDLDARVVHGTGSGQLIHYGTVVDNWQISGSTASFDITKMFENRSGGSIAIEEVGISAPVQSSGGSFTAPVLISRNLIGTTVTVPDGQGLRVRYTITLTVA